MLEENKIINEDCIKAMSKLEVNNTEYYDRDLSKWDGCSIIDKEYLDKLGEKEIINKLIPNQLRFNLERYYNNKRSGKEL